VRRLKETTYRKWVVALAAATLALGIIRLWMGL
jgi:uncharacterized membrane protein YjjP (DUF1212 family)